MQIRSLPEPPDGKTPRSAGRSRSKKPMRAGQQFDGVRYYWPGATLRANLFLDDSLYPIPLAASSKVRVCYAPEGQHNLAQRFSAGKRRVDESGGGTTPSHQSIPKVDAILLPIHLTWLPFHLGFDTGQEVF